MAFVGLAAGVGLWVLASQFVAPVILPPLGVVLAEVWNILSSPPELHAIAITAGRLAGGWVIAAVLGVVLGLATGLVPPVRRVLEPYVVLVQSIPRVSWVLLALFWFGIDGSVVVFLVVMTVVPFFIVNVRDSVAEIREHRQEMMDVFELPGAVRIMDVYLPSVSLALRSAARLSLSVGWKAVVMAELLAAPDGIGARLSWAQGSFDTATVMAWTMIIAAVALGSNAVLERIR